MVTSCMVRLAYIILYSQGRHLGRVLSEEVILDGCLFFKVCTGLNLGIEQTIVLCIIILSEIFIQGIKEYLNIKNCLEMFLAM